ncbi:MAG: T9SS type A sorting domain-containing protein [Saprospiraceae bacterium]|nr:T9SS type A sorting domain-containing protein [Saprospiraceae bacterium]
MNRYLQLALFLCLASYSASHAQDYESSIQVISASGKTGTQNGLTFSYTVGEPFITTLSGNSRKLTQGFHQPELSTSVSVNNPDMADWNIEVFPNPTTDVLTIRFSDTKDSALRATVVNLLGQVMMANQPLTQPDGSRLDCTAWQPGIYILHLQDPSTLGMTSVRFIRL